MKEQQSTSLERVFAHIDKNFPDHLSKVQDYLKHPCFSTENFGVRECADNLSRIIRDLEFTRVEVVEGKVNPIVYGEYDAGAKHTLLVYAKYDNVGVKGQNWKYDPFEAPIAEKPPFGKCIFARGAHGGHAQPRAFLNALESIQKTVGKPPVNLIFVAEGDEELGSPSLPAFVEKYQSKLKRAEAMFSPGSSSQNEYGIVKLACGSTGILKIELECTGARWGKGPREFEIHPSSSPIVDNPLWHMIKCLASLVSEDGNKALIDGFYTDAKGPSPEEDELLNHLAEKFNLENEKQTRGGIREFVNGETNPKVLLTKLLYRPSVYVADLAVKPSVISHRVLAEVTIRTKPDQTSTKIMNLIRQHLDKNGYADIAIRKLSGYEPYHVNPSERIVKATIKAYERIGVHPEVWPTDLGGDPLAIFGNPPLGVPSLGNVALVHGSGGHAPDEYMVVEGRSPYLGLKELEKGYAALLYEYTDPDL
ncbi:MAG: M20/M25/M40 family metallo-hydrolase [Candidatus Bathyarchaeia archaeon]|jgi:acetylornithine deacetylase/succinyl-diaminopimelate desuccinylase-like protein